MRKFHVTPPAVAATIVVALIALAFGWFAGPTKSVFLIGPIMLLVVVVATPVYAIVIGLVLLRRGHRSAILVLLTLIPGLLLTTTALVAPRAHGAAKFVVLRPLLDDAIADVARPQPPRPLDAMRKPLPGASCTFAGLCEYSILGAGAGDAVVFVWNSSGVLKGGDGYGHIIGEPSPELFATDPLDEPAVRFGLGGGWWWMDTRG